MNLDFAFYRQLLIRRLPVMLLILLIFPAVGLAIANKLPAVYEAEARILVERARISDELAPSTVNIGTGEQLDVLREHILTRSTLIDLAHQFDAFEDIQTIEPDSLVSKMRSATRISPRDRRNGATTVSISFRSEDPETSARVANGYVTRLLDKNARMRTDLAENTLRFFELEVDRLSNALSAKSDEIREFSNKNSDTLPDGQTFRLNRQSDLLERQRQLEEELESIRDQKDRVVEIFERTGRVEGLDENPSPIARQLREVERELIIARASFSDTNPRVRLLISRRDQLRQQVEAAEGSSAEQALFNITVAEYESRAQQITEELSRIAADLELLEVAIKRTSEVEIALNFLERDYANIRDQYDRAIDRLATASMGERIEVTSQGQRLTLIEQATVPRSPQRSQQSLIISASAGLGLMGAIGFFVLLELLNTTIRRPAELRTALGITPILTIPFIETRDSRRRRVLTWVRWFLIAFVALPAILWAIHNFYMPLDVMLDYALERLLAPLGLL